MHGGLNFTHAVTHLLSYDAVQQAIDCWVRVWATPYAFDSWLPGLQPRRW